MERTVVGKHSLLVRTLFFHWNLQCSVRNRDTYPQGDGGSGTRAVETSV